MRKQRWTWNGDVFLSFSLFPAAGGGRRRVSFLIPFVRYPSPRRSREAEARGGKGTTGGWPPRVDFPPPGRRGNDGEDGGS